MFYLIFGWFQSSLFWFLGKPGYLSLVFDPHLAHQPMGALQIDQKWADFRLKIARQTFGLQRIGFCQSWFPQKSFWTIVRPITSCYCVIKLILELSQTTPNIKEDIKNGQGFFFQEILRGRGINAYQRDVFCLSFLDTVLTIIKVA